LAKALGAKKLIASYKGVWVDDDLFKIGDDRRGYVSHTDPAVCLQSMQQIHIAQQASDGSWRVATSKGVIIEGCVSTRHYELYGKTLAEAVARCVVAMHLGDEVEVPSELCEQRKEGV